MQFTTKFAAFASGFLFALVPLVSATPAPEVSILSL